MLAVPPDRCLLGCVFFIVDYSNFASSWKKVITEYGGEVEVSYLPRITHVICETLKHPGAQQALQDGKRCVTAYWLNDVIGRKQVVPPWQAIHFPTNFSDGKPCKNVIVSLTQFEDDERKRVRFLIEELGAKYTGYFSKENNILVCKRDEGDKCKKARLWKIPLVNVQWLGDVYLGNGSIKSPESPKYQQFESILGNPFSVDYGSLMHLMAPWKEPLQIPPNLFSAKLNAPPQRPVKRVQNSENVEDETAPQLPGKLFKLSDKKDGSEKYRITFSYIKRKEDMEKKAVELGAVITDNVREATHLVMSELQITFKFLCAISQLQFILSDKWIDESYEQKKFLGEEQYFLGCDAIKEMSGASLAELLSKPNREKLFQEKQFYVTPGVIPGRRYLHEIIECAGGTIQLRRKSVECSHSTDHDAIVKNYIVCGEGDDHLVESMSECCFEIYRPTTVLSAILSQKMLNKNLVDVGKPNKE